MKTVARCCGGRHFTIGNGIETQKCTVCTTRPTILADTILAFFLRATQPRLLKPNATRGTIYPVGLSKATEYCGTILADFVSLDDELDLFDD
jgi:hypothetical protein